MNDISYAYIYNFATTCVNSYYCMEPKKLAILYPEVHSSEAKDSQ